MGDWQFHKRGCKKPDVAMAKGSGKGKDAGYGAPLESESGEAKSQPLRPKECDSEVVKGEDVGSWYNHRDWKPKDEKKDFIPSQLDAEMSAKAPKTASEWNAAGTWEEKSMLPWWKTKLTSLGALKIDKLAGSSRFLRV